MFPALFLYGLDKVKLMPKAFGPLTTMQFTLFFIKLSIAVPLGTAFYPVIGKIPMMKVEDHIMQNYMKTHEGKKPEFLCYNKGM